ncbi:MAG: hypothetical protein HOD97_00995 [Candidatus Marinimicrobia bacterium]|jgi:hypothetical protein|nr:hypothetical protein [Candidatus Neomarinimicrobiota bacterium]MBT3618756.1 hypothetical protein [Candidatus Neomarinimicrobiota bacterium]MBT3828323.1 hypothetical protein [Candidatus Neomarinimicrobiota bacterium]MBT3997216.1 hypothetical protein [Candidatus Neomarinimicrobiota bacterium]MBT4280186.1 hypothetical protein [Candidatus Neomarinimicrobiota bacterium]
MKLITNLTAFSLASVLFFSIACDENVTDPDPESATISGTVTFSGIWPDTGDVSISLQTNWPPTGAPYAYTAITSAELSSNQYSYLFEEVAFGTYKSIAVSWLDPTDTSPMTNQHILGAYGATTQAYFMDADSLVLSVDNAELSELDFNSNLDLATSTQ